MADDAATLLEKAWAANNAGRPASALRHYRRLMTRLAGPAADAPGDPRERARIRVRALLGSALATYELDARLDAADATLSEAADLARREGLDDLALAAEGQRGLVLIRAGRPDDAVAILDAAARRHPADRTEPVDTATLVLNRGSAHLYRGDLASAADDFRRSAELGELIGDRLLAFKARHNLGYVRHLQGDLPGALAGMERARVLDPEGPRPMALLGEARVLLEAGMVTDVDDVLDQAAAGFRAARLERDLAETQLVRAENAVRSGRLDRAQALARDAARRFHRRGVARWEYRAEVIRLRVAAERLLASPPSGSRQRAARRLRAVLVDLRGHVERERDRLTAREISVLIMVVESALPLGEATEKPTAARCEAITSRLGLREAQARSALAEGDLGRAGEVLRTAHRELGRHQDGLASAELRAGMAGWIQRLADLDLDRALRGGRPGQVFGALERWRSRLTAPVPVRPVTDPQTLAALTELRQITARLDEGPDVPEQTRLDARAAQLERRLRRATWSAAAETPQAPAVGAAAHAAAADRLGLATVVPFHHRGDLLMLTRPPGRPWRLMHRAAAVEPLVDRIRADADLLARDLPEAIADVARASLRSSLELLDPVLLGDERLRGHPVAVLAAPALAMLPWGLLPSLRGVPTVVSTSAAAVAAAAQDPPSGREGVVALGGPGLEHADRELAAVAAAWPAASVHARADSDQARAALSSARLVHVAAHGSHNVESPLFSSLWLADGPLFAHELDGVGVPDVTVLSACDLGRSSPRLGAGLGWSTALGQLGCRSTIASTAAVADVAAAVAMGALHTRLAAGDDTATALAVTVEQAWDDGLTLPLTCFGAAVGLTD